MATQNVSKKMTKKKIQTKMNILQEFQYVPEVGPTHASRAPDNFRDMATRNASYGVLAGGLKNIKHVNLLWSANT